ncbi:polysaccharide deacetylase family protein [Litorimonas sp. WD9-15]|uniref:polysaccharide deacetylase family protein n=1 Tax=Litorimonas sp. WD9-15 TaxID=3418716 RepID=UPI003CFCF3C2
MMDRRGFLMGAAAVAGLTACSVKPQGSAIDQKRMAITMDDFTQTFDIGLSLEQRNANILDAFDAVGHKAAGFVTGSFVESEWGEQVVESWTSRGHLIGNHTWTHPHANETPTQDYLADIKRNSDYLRSLGHRTDYFRFPFLDDGRDRAQQVALFEGLNEQGLLNAPVTFDTVDWYTTSRMEAKLRENPQIDLGPYRDYYVEMCVILANYWEETARMLGNIALPHLTLMHHNVLNGHFLKDVLLALKADGWAFVDAADALDMTAYHDLPPEPTMGRNWLTLKRREMGIEALPYPQNYLQFGKPGMDARGL